MVVISRANSLVPAGALAQASGGDALEPSQVKSAARLPPLATTLLVSVNAVLEVLDVAAVPLVVALLPPPPHAAMASAHTDKAKQLALRVDKVESDMVVVFMLQL
jgi:hypothetical protein